MKNGRDPARALFVQRASTVSAMDGSPPMPEPISTPVR
jgi:hypothetical protein